MQRKQLHKYQKRAIDFVIKNDYSLLLLDMGLGKSVIALTAVSDLLSFGDIDKVLVVAPLKVAESTWTRECDKWDHLKWIRCSRILGTKAQREEAIRADADVYITSRDLFVKVMDEAKSLKFDMVILDEITSFKSSKSKRFKSFRKLRPTLSRVVGLTGTPTPNGMKDLWAQMYCIDMGESLGRAKTRFINTYFDTYGKNGIIYNMKLREGAEKKILSSIEKYTLTMKAEDYLSLPDKIEATINVDLSDFVRKQYEEFERSQVMLFDENLTSDKNVIAENAASMCNKLLQFASGAIYDAEHNYHILHNEKIDALMELLESAVESGEHVLVFYQFQHDYARIMERPEMKNYVCRLYKKDQDLEDWNNKKIDVMLTHAASTAYGLNLQEGGRIIVWFGTGWNAELYLQGNARLHRQGQRKTTMIYKIVCTGTMDEDAANAIDGKVSNQEAMLRALKKRMKKYE